MNYAFSNESILRNICPEIQKKKMENSKIERIIVDVI